MPPAVASAPLSMSITLHPIRGFDDVRNITLKPGEPCLIGRASRSTLKHLDARSDNALFDCPVLSREHAELRVHLWDAVENQVTITDKGSMHGTRVNGVKLRQGSPKTLRSGDTVQFGEKVTRGDSSHDGIFVHFTIRQNLTQESNTFTSQASAANPSVVYRYPYTSDEESDYGSDDNVSVLSGEDEVQEISSAKTTPEQAKAKLGSQELPIELDQLEKPKRTTVQDSVDAQASILVQDSLPGLNARAPVAVGAPITVDIDSDDESVIIQPTSVAPPRAMSYVSVEADVDEQDDLDYPDKGEVDDLDDVSDSEASDLNHYSHIEESDEEDEEDDEMYRPISPKPAREPSPELRSSGQSLSSARSAMRETYAPPLAPLNSTYTRPSYGSQTGSYPRTSLAPLSHQFPTYPATYDGYYQPASLTSGFGYDRPLNHTTHLGPGVDTTNGFYSMPATSRWDKPSTYSRVDDPTPFNNRIPGPATFPNLIAPPKYPDSAPHKPFDSSNTWSASPFGDHHSSFTTAGAPSGYSPQSPKINSATGPVISGYYPQSPKSAPAMASTTSRISIPDIVENETEIDNDMSSLYGNVDFEEENARMLKEAKKMTDEAKQMVQKAQEEEAPPSPLASASRSAGTKRKASEGDALAQGPELVPDIHDSAFEVQVPPPASKKAKTAKEAAITPTFNGTLPVAPSNGSIAGSIAKYTAVASAGGVGMLAFLCSPASEKLLTWLS